MNAAAAMVAALARRLSAQAIETPISWVLLTADSAYKIKKPVRLPFVDYASPAARRHFCEEELRLNGRLAPSLYVGVVRITGSPDEPVLDGSGPVLDHAVHMRRFAPGALFSEQVEAGTLQPAQVDRLAGLLAGFHAAAPRLDPAGDASRDWASPSRRRTAALAALAGARPLLQEAGHDTLKAWIEREADALAPLWSQRRAQGHVRECHGDLHLANVVRLGDDVAAFDGIEFDPALRWIDVIDDVAFVVMDFEARARPDFGCRFLNAWLDGTGEHEGLPALRFAVVYRALVRAQVEGLRGEAGTAAARRYLAVAQAWTGSRAVRLVITHGLPGSGKTFASQGLLEREGAVRLRSDVERKRLFGFGMLEDTRRRAPDLYGAEATRRTYERLLALAGMALRAGYPVVVDAAFLQREERRRAQDLASGLGVRFSILDCQAPLPVLRERLRARAGDASEANVAVLERLAPLAQPLDETERRHAFSVVDAAQAARGGNFGQ